MSVFASMTLEPSAFAAWLVVGAVAGWLGGKILGEATYGAIGDVFLGGIGALTSALAFAWFYDGAEFWGSVLVALTGACVLIGGARALAANRNA